MRMIFVSTQWPVDPCCLEDKLNRPDQTTQLIFKERFVLWIEIMNFYRNNSAGYISVSQFDVSAELIFLCHFVKCA